MADKIIDNLKAVLLTLLLPGIFFLFMGPIKLVEMYPEYNWVRYLPLATFFIPALFLICRREEGQ